MADGDVPAGDDDRAGTVRELQPDAAELPRAVQDMEDIFGKPSGTRPKAAATRLDSIGPVVGPRKRRAPRPISPPILLLGGLAMGVSLAWLALSPPTPTGLPTARQVERAYDHAALPPRRVEGTPILPAVSPVLPVPVAQTAAYAPAVTATGTPAVADAGTEGTTGTRRYPSVVAAASRGRAIGAQRRDASRLPAAGSEEPCGDRGGFALARCMRPEILAADRRLRDAYDDAVRAGVDRQLLVSTRNRWARLSDEAVARPYYVADSFQRMAQRLDAERAAAAESGY